MKVNWKTKIYLEKVISSKKDSQKLNQKLVDILFFSDIIDFVKAVRDKVK